MFEGNWGKTSGTDVIVSIELLVYLVFLQTNPSLVSYEAVNGKEEQDPELTNELFQRVLCS